MNQGPAGSSLGIALRGRGSNSMGLGARVEVRLPGGGRLFQEHRGDTGFFRSVSCGPLHFGVGRVRQVEVRLRWPCGRRQAFAGLPVDRTVVLFESGPLRPPPEASPAGHGGGLRAAFRSDLDLTRIDLPPAPLLEGFLGIDSQGRWVGERSAVLLGRRPDHRRWRLEGSVGGQQVEARLLLLAVRINGHQFRHRAVLEAGPFALEGPLPLPAGARVRIDVECGSAAAENASAAAKGEDPSATCVRLHRIALME